MAKHAPKAPTSPEPAAPARRVHWAALLGLGLLTVALVALSLAPLSQFYLAWIALTPFLLMVASCRSAKPAFFWGWWIGVAVFVANMWFLTQVTIPGTIALLVFLGLYWGIAASIIRSLNLLGPGANPLASVFAIASIWTGCEYLRGTLLSGLPWIYIGHTQTPLLVLCQIADLTGVYGVSFWVVLISALVALAVLRRRSHLRSLLPAACAIAALLVAIGAYGVFRMNQTRTRPGPTIFVFQPNIPQDNSGSKGASQEDLIDVHVTRTREALEKLASQNRHVDLVVWSETMMPALNPEARAATVRTAYGYLFESAHDQIASIAKQYHSSFIVGSVGVWNATVQVTTDDKGQQWERLHATDRRNSAFFYLPGGAQSPLRYDKIHLVPFGEFIPFKDSLPFLYHIFLSLSPYTDDYTLQAGGEDAMTVFPVPMSDKNAAGTQPSASPQEFRAVVPICFEDIVAPLVRRMFRDESGGGGGKRADVIINITNDGWFGGNEREMHLQTAIFRSIENRVPTARAVNTGVSGFVDSVGRTSNLIAAGTEGFSVQTLALDDRVTIYTRVGDVFAWLCVAITVALAAVAIVSARRGGEIDAPATASV